MSSRPFEHPGEIIGSREKRAPMELIVTLGQQYHVGVCVGQPFIFF